MKRERKPLSLFSKIMIGCIAVVTAFMLIIALMNMAGIRLIRLDLSIMGAILLLTLFVVWGIGAVIRRLKKMMAKYLAGAAMGTVALIAITVIFAYISNFALAVNPSEFTTLKLENGREIVVMYMPDLGFVDPEGTLARMDARAEYRKSLGEGSDSAEAVETDVDEPINEYDRPAEDYGYVFTAYPKTLGFFIKVNEKLEGELYRGLTSEAKIMYELSEESLRIYVENPEPGDYGELTEKY